METLREIFDPGFLMRNSVYIGLLVGFACPLVGVHLIMRRLVFLGVALPQISSCGIAFAFALPGWGLLPHAHDSVGEHGLAFIGATVFALGSILVLAVLERRGRGLVEGRIGAAYALAGALGLLLLATNPLGEHGMLDLLKGEIIAVSNFEVALTAGTFALVASLLFLLQKEFLLVSFDREMAVTMRKNVVLWDALLFALIGLSISVSVLSVGPLVTFGFLLIPPLIAYCFARTMRQFVVGASLIGGVTAVLGFCLSYRWDLPTGPTDVALLGALLAVAFVGKKGVQLTRRLLSSRQPF